MAKAKRAIKYYVVDSFADSPLKGNPAAVCLLDWERKKPWMQAVGREFNISATCFLNEISTTIASENQNGHHHHNAHGRIDHHPKFRLRWFAPDVELNICGHGTLASAYVLFSTGLVKSKTIEFHTESGIMMAERINNDRSIIAREQKLLGANNNGEEEEEAADQKQADDDDGFSVRLTFPLVPVVPCSDPLEIKLIPKSVNIKPSTINITKMNYEGELLVELSSGELVMELEPSLDEIRKWPGRGVVVTGAAPVGSGFDFYSRFFCPNLGMNEDPVCGSVHCGLAPYWSKKLGKTSLKAYMASPRGGALELHVDMENQKVLMQGKVVPVMEGLLLID